ncbi:MAG: type III pantothenate kinase [Candidatus Sumerlaeia bacterium]|nr:type III pantothenate kinase [Candidatus Sumerlaeia bacterium]
MILTIDIGNTHTNLALFDGDAPRNEWTFATVLHRTADEYLVLLDHLLDKAAIERSTLAGAVVASVVPPLTATWQTLAAALVGRQNVLVMGAETPTGIENRYQSPHDVGADRLANAVAAKKVLGCPVIVVDFGTATTLDVVSCEGAYLGGAILPGPEMMSESLYRKTARLPRVAIEAPKRVIGNSTDASMRAGIFFGTIGAIDSLIERIFAELGGPCPVIATGGAARPFAEASRHIGHHDPLLTLRGLNEIWKINRGKS